MRRGRRRRRRSLAHIDSCCQTRPLITETIEQASKGTKKAKSRLRRFLGLGPSGQAAISIHGQPAAEDGSVAGNRSAPLYPFLKHRPTPPIAVPLLRRSGSLRRA